MEEMFSKEEYFHIPFTFLFNHGGPPISDPTSVDVEITALLTMPLLFSVEYTFMTEFPMCESFCDKVNQVLKCWCGPHGLTDNSNAPKE